MSTQLEPLTNQLIEIEKNIRALGQWVRGIVAARTAARELAANLAEQTGLLTGKIRGYLAATGCRPSEPLPQATDFGEQADAFSLGQARGRVDGLLAGLQFMERRAGA